MGTHLQPASVDQRKFDSFPCRTARTQPEVEREGHLSGPPHVPTHDGGPACHQAQGADADTQNVRFQASQPSETLICNYLQAA